jgi:uncharacterized protein (TIGR02271 family)
MAEETVVAVYETADQADAAIRDLHAAHVPAEAITRHNERITGTDKSATATASIAPSGFWAKLFGGEPDHDTAVYDHSIENGAIVVSVKTPEQHVGDISEILERHHPVDLDDRASAYTTTQTATMQAPASAAGGTSAAKPNAAVSDASDTIQLAAETLAVGKRAVNRGTTRVRRYVVETPVAQQVTLRDETVSVERRPVAEARPVGAADFTDRVVEFTESDEEAVVSKTARVREEVVIRKDTTERVETVHDTVRREEIEVERTPGPGPAESRLAATAATTPGLPTPRTPAA